MVVNLAIILAIFHYIIFPLARELKKDMNPEEKTVTAVTFENNGKQTVTRDYGTD